MYNRNSTKNALSYQIKSKHTAIVKLGLLKITNQPKNPIFIRLTSFSLSCARRSSTVAGILGVGDAFDFLSALSDVDEVSMVLLISSSVSFTLSLLTMLFVVEVVVVVFKLFGELLLLLDVDEFILFILLL